jgi:DNA-binding transcriptional LysR family regulator
LEQYQPFVDNHIMKLTEMELLVRVAETGSMTVAARQLHLTPAAVSAAVRRVEDSLGIRLFERTTRSIHPTDDGLAVLDGCQSVLERWQSTLEAVRGAGRALIGTVHLAAPADTSYQMLAPVLAAVCEAHPQLRVVAHSSDTVHHLHREAIDMAIRYGPLQDSGLTARKLAAHPAVLVASPRYLDQYGRPETPADLAAHRCLTLRLSNAEVTHWSLQGPAGPQRVALHSPLCGDGYLNRRWAIDGKGIASKSLFDVIEDLASGRLERVLPEHDGGLVAIHMVFPSRRHLPARVRAVDRAISIAFAERAMRCDAWLAGTLSRQA